MNFIATNRLILRTLNDDDAEEMYDYRNSEVCSRYQRGQVRKLSEISTLIKKHENDAITCGNRFMIGIALKETGDLIGEISAKPDQSTISLGYTLSYKHHRKGYASEALSALLSFIHERYPNTDFICFTDPNNQASMGLLIKLGFEHLGYIPHMDAEAFGKWVLPATRKKIEQAKRQDKGDN